MSDQENNNGPMKPTWKVSLKEKTQTLLSRFPIRRKRNHDLDSASPPPNPTFRGDGFTTMRKREVLNFAEWAGKGLQNRGYAFYGKLLTLVLCSYFLADVAAMMAGKYIPEPPSAKGNRKTNISNRNKTMEDYNAIFTRNLFNRKGLIPGEETGGGPVDQGGAPVKTTLPFNLIGTLILKDEMRSIATIEDKSASMVYPVRIEEEIPTKAKIIKIEPRRVIFLNMQSGRREFAELPEETLNSNAHINLGSSAKSGPSIENIGGHQFNIARSEVDKALSDFNTILTQARAVPNFENGAPAGYKLFQIVPGSIYDKLGLKNGDVIAGVDGQPINDPAKAFELLGKLKDGAGHLELQMKRDGSSFTSTYDIR